jgi:N-acetylmuramoyl-L-alanine amidase
MRKNPVLVIRKAGRFLRRRATVAVAAGIVVSMATIAGPMLSVSAARAEGPAAPALRSMVSNVRLGEQGDVTRLVIDFGRGNSAPQNVFTLAEPYRVVIDLKDADFQLPPEAGKAGRGLVTGFRYGQFQEGLSRIVVDATGPVSISRHFALPAQSGFGHRIVVDLKSATAAEFAQSVGLGRPISAPTAAAPPVSTPREPTANIDRKRVIVIDAGHGGVDPGTHGQSGALEKDVVLAFAKEFGNQLRATGRYEVHLTRDTDRFIPLRERVNITRRHNADLFLSVHADAIDRRGVSGMSIYTLSENASDKEAAALAAKENRSDVIAGVDLQGESSEVTDILIDLAQRETKNFSVRFARTVVRNADGVTPLLQRTHRFAGFRVLKAPDVPSVLVELGFLTNRDDERNLTTSSWRRRVAGALVKSVDSYFGERYAEGTY